MERTRMSDNNLIFMWISLSFKPIHRSPEMVIYIQSPIQMENIDSKVSVLSKHKAKFEFL